CYGSYHYDVTDAASSCHDTGTVVVYSYPLPLLPVPFSANICLGGSAVLCATGASSYSWSPPTALNSVTTACPTANPTQTIIYTVVGTSTMGCTSSSTITVIVNPTPSISLNVNNAT